ncbi:MAG: TspO/MBR family protein [Pyrinomonadaceae bacterium]
MNDKIQQILVIAATVGMLIFNWLAATGILGGIDTGAVSDKYDTHITPAGYAFAIWSLIYLGMIAFSIYQTLPSQAERFRGLRRIYIVSCVANCAWLYVWSQEAIVVCLGIIIVLLVSIGIINVKLRETESLGEFWLAKVPFGIYFGWVTAATILNATIALVYLGVKLPDATSNLIGAVLILIAAALGAFVRWKLVNYFYPLAVAWAITAIAVQQSGQTIVVVAAAFGVIVCLIAAVSFVMDMKSSEI